MTLCFFDRLPFKSALSGPIVSKSISLPQGKFSITEYTWEKVSLWFVDSDRFSADDRRTAYRGFCKLKAQSN